MEIILSILFLLAFWLYYRYTDKKASDHCNTYNIDWEKVNEDRIKNDLSGTQINKNIAIIKIHMPNFFIKSVIVIIPFFKLVKNTY